MLNLHYFTLHDTARLDCVGQQRCLMLTVTLCSIPCRRGSCADGGDC